MIVAIILADRTSPCVGNTPPYLLSAGAGVLIERIAETVLRGPFGGTLIAPSPETAEALNEALEGFSVQHVPAGSERGPHAALRAGLRAAEALRQRWEKLRAMAASKFTGGDDDSDDAPRRPKKHRRPDPRAQKSHDNAAAPWSKLKANADVKLRGLARSFDRDGVIVFRGERPLIVPELQAEVVEAFGREGAKGSSGAPVRDFAQAVHAGIRGYPIAMSLSAAKEVADLPPSTLFDDWLLDRLPRIQDVPVNSRGAIESIDTEEDYDRLHEANLI